MKFALASILALVMFVLVASGLWRTVGGLVEQAGAREDRSVNVDVQFSLVDADGSPIGDAPVRLLLGRLPQEQPPSAGREFVTDAAGAGSFSTRATIDKTARTRPSNFLDSLFAKAEPTDHVTFGVELGYMAFRWLYTGDLYRFADGDVVWPDGLALFTRDEQRRFAHKAVFENGGWRIADLGTASLSTQGHELTQFRWEPTAGVDHWQLSLVFRRHATPIAR